MYTSMTSALSLLLLALIPATIAVPPPASSTSATPSSTRAAVPLGTGQSCPHNPSPIFPQPAAQGGLCKTEGEKACTADETGVLVCTGGKWGAPTNCGQKEGFQMACRSYANLMKSGGCYSYGPVYTECTGYEDADVHETVSSEVGWDAQATGTPIPPPHPPVATATSSAH